MKAFSLRKRLSERNSNDVDTNAATVRPGQEAVYLYAAHGSNPTPSLLATEPALSSVSSYSAASQRGELNRYPSNPTPSLLAPEPVSSSVSSYSAASQRGELNRYPSSPTPSMLAPKVVQIREGLRRFISSPSPSRVDRDTNPPLPAGPHRYPGDPHPASPASNAAGPVLPSTLRAGFGRPLNNPTPSLLAPEVVNGDLAISRNAPQFIRRKLVASQQNLHAAEHPRTFPDATTPNQTSPESTPSPMYSPQQLSSRSEDLMKANDSARNTRLLRNISFLSQMLREMYRLDLKIFGTEGGRAEDEGERFRMREQADMLFDRIQRSLANWEEHVEWWTADEFQAVQKIKSTAHAYDPRLYRNRNLYPE